MLGLQTQRVLQRRMDVAANNLANVATSGFKADALVFEEVDDTGAQRRGDADARSVFVRDIGLMRDMSQGPIAMTGNPLDVALEGDGFFMVEGPNGPLYTRDGAFTLTGEGRLVTSDGRAVLSSGGAPIVFDPQGESPSIGRDGAITRGRRRSRPHRRGVASPRPARSQRSGTTFGTRKVKRRASSKASSCKARSKARTFARCVELTRLIEISRAYQSAAKIVSGADELRQRAIERLGR